MNEIITTGTNDMATTEISADLYTRFIAYLDTSEKTRQTYTINLRQFFAYLANNGITRPSRADIIAYRDHIKATGHKATTVQNYMAAVKIFFRWTATEGIYPNVADHIKGAKVSRDHKKDYLTADQVSRILAGIDRTTAQGIRDYAIMALMVGCGLRDIEVVRANVEDLGTAAGHAVIYVQGKGRDDRNDYVKMPAQVEQAIRAYLRTRPSKRGNEPLFASMSRNNNGGRMTTRAVSGIVKTRMRNAGYDSERLTAHSLRHTAVTLALLNGNTLEEAQDFARHRNITTTMIYNHAIDHANNHCADDVCNAIFGANIA